MSHNRKGTQEVTFRARVPCITDPPLPPTPPQPQPVQQQASSSLTTSPPPASLDRESDPSQVQSPEPVRLDSPEEPQFSQDIPVPRDRAKPGILGLCFRGDPPDVDPARIEELGVCLSPFQELLLGAALEAGVFTLEQAPKWRAAALIQEAMKQAEDDERRIEFLRLAGLIPEEEPAEETEEDEEADAEDEEK
ncbi:hypothetical protein CONLIGDRAFT_638679 [Coniochaeta ligniaria NRRL 30616]|uniref:Uncharacterized protein n=1 Tax=Coniochaeta ligniaria NRRL 30616 TaxID=1408157 RepID=A0A1J7JLN2_9PEZI|nr:hypothetical protein CONLIGDRAFT_638679 [Coniochaeta ligniaria NRRL 30616]